MGLSASCPRLPQILLGPAAFGTGATPCSLRSSAGLVGWRPHCWRQRRRCRIGDEVGGAGAWCSGIAHAGAVAQDLRGGSGEVAQRLRRGLSRPRAAPAEHRPLACHRLVDDVRSLRRIAWRWLALQVPAPQAAAGGALLPRQERPARGADVQGAGGHSPQALPGHVHPDGRRAQRGGHPRARARRGREDHRRRRAERGPRVRRAAARGGRGATVLGRLSRQDAPQVRSPGQRSADRQLQLDSPGKHGELREFVHLAGLCRGGGLRRRVRPALARVPAPRPEAGARRRRQRQEERRRRRRAATSAALGSRPSPCGGEGGRPGRLRSARRAARALARLTLWPRPRPSCRWRRAAKRLPHRRGAVLPP
mmetsp:Transcript_148648/g.378208  ORF Transcript_148648/g.378208 Transcript_148648/m.378208 type:complete len:366 (-) Transcript_148648:684-1781(-)